MAAKPRAPHILIAASGTGGHLFPALYIAEALRSINSECAVEFIGSGRQLEERIIDQHGYTRHVVNISGLKNRGLRGLFTFLSQAPRAIQQTRTLLGNFKPDAVIGVGGYASVFPVLLAALRKTPTLIHEAEIEPGLATRILLPFCTRATLAFSNSSLRERNKCLYTGHPVRPDIKTREISSAPGEPTRLLILGGSQGSAAIDRALLSCGELLRNSQAEIRHQCRPENQNELEEFYSSNKLNYELFTFIDDMASVYDWAHIIVSRSGAGSVMELGVVAKPSLLIPYPHAQGDHQAANAQVLVELGKARMLREGSGFDQQFALVLTEMFQSDLFHKMWQAEGDSRSRDAAQTIGRIIMELAGFPDERATSSSTSA